MNEQTSRRQSRGRLMGGIILLLVGCFLLADNLGMQLPKDWLYQTPWALVILGVIQVAWPSSLTERLNGIWLITIGFYLLIGWNEWFSLSFLTALPIFVIALGLRMVLGTLFHKRPE